jgi:hypothetical protein
MSGAVENSINNGFNPALQCVIPITTKMADLAHAGTGKCINVIHRDIYRVHLGTCSDRVL